jgi:hypothetical protein
MGVNMANYRTDIKCKNCGTTRWLEIEVGITAKQYCIDESVKCDYCKCLLIEEKEEKDDD